jgi:hypothetical protein
MDASTVTVDRRLRQAIGEKCQNSVFRGRLASEQKMRVPSPSSLTPVAMLPLLLMAHFVCDFGLQSDRMAREKCSGCDKTLPWGWWMAGHVSTHGLAVALITGVPWLGLAEAAIHALIDHRKCAGQISLTTDQLLHLLCKALWVVVLAAG